MIKFHKSDISEEDIQAMNEVMRSGWMAAGAETEAFEKEFAKYVGVKYAIFTNSCTSALKMAFKLVHELGNKPLNSTWFEVPRNTFCATYAAIEETPYCHFVYHGTNQRESLAYHPVNMHMGGVKDETPCLIEDSAHRIEQSDPLVGKIRCYSFYVTKNMTTVQGGMFVTNDKEIYERARLYWRDGLSNSTSDRQRGSVDYEVKAFAGGYDSNDVFAALGRSQLKRLPDFTAARNRIRDRYNDAFGLDWLGNHLYCFPTDSSERCKEAREFLKEKGIGTSLHYPGTGWNHVSLPIYPSLEGEEQDYIIEQVKVWSTKG